MSSSARPWPSTGNGPFFLHIAGLPRDYDWKKLKDMLRNMNASHGVWADMAISSWGQPSGEGYARMARRTEAECVFGHLVNAKRYNVHAWDITSSAPKFIGCNCPQVHDVSSRYVAQVNSLNRDPNSWMSVTPPQAVHQPTLAHPGNVNHQYVHRPEDHATQVANYELARRMQQMQIQQQYQEQAAFHQAAPNFQMVPNAVNCQPSGGVPSSRRLPVNLSQGYARTESRGVFIGNLDYKVTERDLKAHFARAGKIVECKIKKHSANNKSKGAATIQFETVKQAENAIAKFNETDWRGRELVVRFDIVTTTTQAPPTSTQVQENLKSTEVPTIVDGTGLV